MEIVVRGLGLGSGLAWGCGLLGTGALGVLVWLLAWCSVLIWDLLLVLAGSGVVWGLVVLGGLVWVVGVLVV
eukprot:5289652-Amphidinium_carterae.1